MEPAFWGKAAVVVVVLVGMALCSSGIGKVAAAGAWLDPRAITAYVLGVAALIVAVGALIGAPLPLLGSPWAAAMAVAAVILVKAAIARLHAL